MSCLDINITPERLIRRCVPFLLSALWLAAPAQSPVKTKFTVVNAGPVNWVGRVIGLPWPEFSRELGILDTARFRVVDSRSRRELPVQFEQEGTGAIRNLLIQVDVKAGDSVEFRLERRSRTPLQAKTYGRYVPERKDDFAWENDRIAFRAYGKALENTSENAHGIDVWAKRTQALVINDRYRRNDYHEDHGDGLDYYSVGATMGAGNMAPFFSDSVWYPGNYSRWEVLDNGPLRTTFRLHHEPRVLGGITVSSMRTISLDAGSYVNRITIRYVAAGVDSIPVVVGIARRKDPGALQVDERRGLMSYWEPTHPRHGTTGVAVLLPGRQSRLVARPSQYLLAFRLPVNKDYTYYAGACWDKEGNFTDAGGWASWMGDLEREVRSGSVMRIRYH